jgi:hypothetical protein
MVAVCYIIAIMKWRPQGTAFIWATAIDALLTFLFAGLGGVFGGLVSAFGGPALHKMGTLTMFLWWRAFGF